MKLPLGIISIVGCLVLLFFSKARGTEMITKKTPTILASFIRSQGPVNFAKTHDIGLKDGMVRVVMTVDESFLLRAFVSKYDLKDYKKRKHLVTSYVTIESLKGLKPVNLG